MLKKKLKDDKHVMDRKNLRIGYKLATNATAEDLNKLHMRSFYKSFCLKHANKNKKYEI